MQKKFKHLLLAKSFIAIVGLFAFAPCEGKQSTDTTVVDRPVTDKWALIVGISKFQQRTLPELRYAAKDASDFRDYLVQKANFAPDHVRLLLNEKATRKEILSGLDKFLGRVARKDDLVLVYFSTHGSPESADVRGKSYLVSHDADKEDLFATAIPMSDIMDLVRDRISSDRVLLVMDTCFSGATCSSGSKSISDSGNLDATKIAQGSGQLVICSSSPKERSWESRRYENGVFTKKLMDSLSSKGSLTKLGTAFASARDEVENEVREDQGIRQRPVLASANWKGEDLMLAAPPAAPREVPAAVKALLDPDSSSHSPAAADRSIVRTTEETPSPESSTGTATPSALLEKLPAGTTSPSLTTGTAPGALPSSSTSASLSAQQSTKKSTTPSQNNLNNSTSQLKIDNNSNTLPKPNKNCAVPQVDSKTSTARNFPLKPPAKKLQQQKEKLSKKLTSSQNRNTVRPNLPAPPMASPWLRPDDSN